MYLEKVQQKQEVLRQAGFEEFVPCSEEEVGRLEDWLGQRLPLAYREFLLWMGHWGGGLFRGSDCFYENLEDLQEWTRTLLEEDQNPVSLPEDAFTFFMHQGYQFFFFRLSEGEDPPVYYYLEADGNPAESKFTCANAHFSDWLDNCVDKGVEAARMLAARVQRRKGSTRRTGSARQTGSTQGSPPTDPERARAFAEGRSQHNK